MREFKINELNRFMGKLLKSETFDGFLLKEGTVRTFIDYQYSGEIHKEWYDTPEAEVLMPERYIGWQMLREQIYDIIKGKHTPLYIKLVLCAGNRLKSELFPNVSDDIGLNLNFIYKEKTGVLITGFYRSSFSTDKEPERIWDDCVEKFLFANDISAEIM